MLVLAYADERQRAQAVVSVARLCGSVAGGRLIFLGSPAACASTQETMRRLALDPPAFLTFRSLPLETVGTSSGTSSGTPSSGTPRGTSSGTPSAATSWSSHIEALRVVMQEMSAAPNPPTVWVEAAFVGGAEDPSEQCATYDAVEELAHDAVGPVIVALPLQDLEDDNLRRRLLRGLHVLINAQMVVPHCPRWVLDLRGASLVPASMAGPAEPSFSAAQHAKDMVTLGQFAAGVAHEIGNPLSIISSSLQYLHQRLVDTGDPARDFTHAALENVERMQGLLRGMLDFGGFNKSQSGHIDLREVVTNVFRFTAAECRRCSVIADVSFDPSLPRIWGDPSAIGQVILNLVKNALEAMADSEAGAAPRLLVLRARLNGGQPRSSNTLSEPTLSEPTLSEPTLSEPTLSEPTLSEPTRPQQPAGIIIELYNTGPLIPDDVLPRLFQPFFTTKDDGTGLGLYLSRQIARRHGGDLRVDNMPTGVRFSLVLPIDRRANDRGHAWHTC